MRASRRWVFLAPSHQMIRRPVSAGRKPSIRRRTRRGTWRCDRCLQVRPSFADSRACGRHRRRQGGEPTGGRHEKAPTRTTALGRAARFRQPDFPLFERNTHAIAPAPSDAASSITLAAIQANVELVGNRWVTGKTQAGAQARNFNCGAVDKKVAAPTRNCRVPADDCSS
jgi:hypothetical protein